MPPLNNFFRLSQVVKQHGILVGIFGVAFMIRFYTAGGDAFMNDEFSGWVRSRFVSFSDLLELGILPDGHPALTAIILWLFPGETPHPLLLRLPFMAAGLGSFYLFYHATNLLYGKYPALFLLCSMAFLQPFVFHTQTARPYALGLLGTALCFYSWAASTRNNKNYAPWFWVPGFLIAATSHYFALLQVICIAVGLLFQPQRHRFIYPFLTALFLFIPHIPITLHHLQIGGLGWLAPPSLLFVSGYLNYLFHFSPWLILAIVVAVIVPRSIPKAASAFNPFILFIVPMGILFLYSYWVAPVLQYAALLFASPFLLLFLGIIIFRSNHNFRNNCVLYGISILYLYTLLGERKHAQVMEAQPFYRATSWLNEKVSVLPLAINQSYLNLALQQKGKLPVPDNNIFVSIKSALEQSPDSLICLSSNPAERAALLTRYARVVPFSLGFTHEHLGAYQPGLNICHKDGLSHSHLDTTWDGEFSPSVNFPLPVHTRFLHVGAWAMIDSSDGFQELVWQLSQKNEIVRWGNNPIDKGLHVFAWTGFRLEDFLRPGENTKDLAVNIYIWDKRKGIKRKVKIECWVWEGNPFRYGLVEPINR